MLKLSRRALAVVLFTLLALTASLTVAAAPAGAAYGATFVCNRHVAHRGQAVGCTLHHFATSHRGNVTVTARFWVHKRHVHHRVLTKHAITKVLATFVTSQHGNKIVAFNIPNHIRKGTHAFTANVRHKHLSVRIRVV